MSVLHFARSRSPLPSDTDVLARQDISLSWMPEEFAEDEHGFYAASDLDWLGIEAHFARFGFRITRHAPLESYQEGLRYLSNLVSMVGYLRDYPGHYKIFAKDWSSAEHEYLRAVSAADLEQVANLLPLTRFSIELAIKMRTRKGCALKTT